MEKNWINYGLEAFEIDSRPDTNLWQLISPPDQSHHWILFLGSFFPWHAGHFNCAELAPGHLPLVVMPDFSPWKNHANQLADFSANHPMIKDLQKLPQARLYLGHLLKKTSNPTISWLPKLKEKVHKIELLMGDDTYLSLPAWERWSELKKYIDGLWVVNRKHTLSELQKKQLSLPTHWLGPGKFPELSSTAIRQKQQMK